MAACEEEKKTCLVAEHGKTYFLCGVDRRRRRRATEYEDQQRLQELLQRRINQRSEYMAKNVIVDCSYAKSFTPRQKFADQAMLWENIFAIWSAKFHTCVHTGEKTRVCHLRNKRFFHANAQYKHYTAHIRIDT